MKEINSTQFKENWKMRKEICGLLFLSVFLLAGCTTTSKQSGEQSQGITKTEVSKYEIEYNDGIVTTIDKRILDVAPELFVKYEGAFKKDFPNGMKTGYGSGMTFKGKIKDGYEFYVLTDRGPNGDGPTYKEDDKVKSTKLFPVPLYTPQIGIARVTSTEAIVYDTITIKDNNGKDITGLPIPEGDLGSTNEIPFSDTLERLKNDKNGLDTEGIAVDKDGNFWICDEYGPFIVKLDSNGKILKKYGAGQGLPEMIKYRHPNRGMEGITITPNGKIYAVVQSTLNINDKKTRDIAQFVRMVELNPLTGETKTFAYPIEVKSYAGKNKNCKIGDLFAISDSKIVLIEQGNIKEGMMNKLFLIDISNATDITGMKNNGKDLEYVSDITTLDINFIEKKEILNLRDYGWEPSKAEGLTVLDDNQTIVVINDNDFDMATKTKNENGDSVDIKNYTLNADGSFTNSKNGNIEKLTLTTEPANEPLNLWFIHLSKPLIQ